MTQRALSAGAVLLGLLLPSTMAGCSGDGGGGQCTLIGCESKVSFDVADLEIRRGTEASARICMNGVCSTGTTMRLVDGSYAQRGSDAVSVEPSGVSLRLGKEHEGGKEHRVALRLRMPGRDVVEFEDTIALEESRPNGADCGPVCVFARVEVQS